MANDVRQDIQEGIILPLLTKPISYVHLCSQTFGRKERICPLTSWLVFLAGMIVPFVTLPKNIFLWLDSPSLFFAFLTYFFIQYLGGLPVFGWGIVTDLRLRSFLSRFFFLDPPALDLFLTGPNDHRLAPFSLLHMFRFPLFLTSFSTRMVCAHGRIFVDFRVYAFFKVVVDSRIKAI